MKIRVTYSTIQLYFQADMHVLDMFTCQVAPSCPLTSLYAHTKTSNDLTCENPLTYKTFTCVLVIDCCNFTCIIFHSGSSRTKV